MPHGGGNAGGGGFHGGGYHGGYYGGYYGRHGRRRGGPFSGLIWLTFAAVICVLLLLSLSLALGTEPHMIRSSETYGLTDNRLISYRGDFCTNLRASSTVGPKEPSYATLAFLSSRPPLTGRQMFNFSDSVDLGPGGNSEWWNFYLNYNSNVSIDVCYEESHSDYSVTFYVVKSTENFDRWFDNPGRSQDTIRTVRLRERCTSISYRVVGDEVYYFVFYLSGRQSTSLDVTFRFNRTLYEISSDMVVKNCSFSLDGRSQCVLDAPMTPGYTGFLSVNSDPPINYNDGARISISCTPRGWLYAVIVLAVVFVSACLIGGFVAVCVSVIKANLKKKAANATTTTTSVGTSNSVNPESVLVKDGPPPYPTAPSAVDYGTDAPPPYYKDNEF